MMPAKSKGITPGPSARPHSAKPPLGRIVSLGVALATPWSWTGCEQEAGQGFQPRQAKPPSFLSEAKLDDAAARFADALRRWPVVHRADAPVVLARPRWRNESDLPVEQGHALALRLARKVNLRTGAKVSITGIEELGCHYATELVLLPAKDGQGQPVLALAWRVVRPGTGRSLLEEVCIVRRAVAQKPPAPLFGPAPQARPATQPGSTGRSYHQIRFDHGRVHLDARLAGRRVRVLGEHTWRDVDGRMRIELRLVSLPTETTVEVLAYYIDEAGRRRPPMQASRQTLAAFRPDTLALTLPKAARSYELFIVAR